MNAPPFRSERLRLCEDWLITGVMLLLGYAAWMRGGAYVPLQGPLPVLGALLLVMLFVVPLLTRGDNSVVAVVRSRLRRLLSDPIFYLGLAFMALLLLQWWNAGRAQLFDEATGRWIYSSPPHPGWPSAVTRAEAAEMLRWFFPAWTLLLVLRSRAVTFRGARILCLAMVVNAAVLAVIGVKNYIPVLTRADGHLFVAMSAFANFDYANHAASFFVLMLLLGLGLLLHELVGRGERRIRRGRVVLLSILVALTLAGANLSLSRAGMLSWVFMLIAVGYALIASWRQVEPAVRLNIAVGCIGVVCLTFFFVDGFGKAAFGEELGRLIKARPEVEMASRQLQSRVALDIWKANPWFGVGGWGYRYLAGTYVDRQDRFWWSSGRANVHNDPLQFLAEFGAVGAGILAVGALVMLAPVMRRGILRQPVVLFPLSGLAWTFGHSMVDLPFRCPAILYHWLTILACLPLIKRPSAYPRAKHARTANFYLEEQRTKNQERL